MIVTLFLKKRYLKIDTIRCRVGHKIMTNVSRAILESIGEGLIAIDTKKKIMMVNKAAEDMLGWKTKDLLGQKLTNLPLADERGDIVVLQKRPLSLALSDDKIINTTYFYIRRDKTRFPASITTTPIKRGNKIIGAVGIFRDVTDEKALDKAKSEFIYIASHGLMTPLSVAKLYLEGAQKNAYFRKAPKAVKEYIDEIYKSNARSITLVRNLLSVSRIDQGKVHDAPEMVNIMDLIKKIVKEMGTIAAKSNVALSLRTKQKEIPETHIDPLRLREVVENLITNAIKYNVPHGEVEVILEKKGDVLVLSVMDTGIGIAEADQKNLFIKFFRTEKAVITNAEGSGLGLYVVKSYVEGWGGKISVKSGEGKGSTFTIRIPFNANVIPVKTGIQKR